MTSPRHPSSAETGAASLGAVAGVVAIIVVVAGVFMGLRAGEDPAPSPRPAANSAPTDSSGESEDQASTETSGESTDESTAARPDWLSEAVAAGKDGYPAFVPAEVPAGWSADAATYEPSTSWHLELTSPSGAQVVLDQRSSGSVTDVVDELIGSADRAGSVNLRRWGTGTWTAFESDGAVALAQELAGTVVVVSGATGRDEIIEITKQLLTVEMAVNVGDGSDG